MRVILKWILKKQDTRARKYFIWLWVGSVTMVMYLPNNLVTAARAERCFMYLVTGMWERRTRSYLMSKNTTHNKKNVLQETNYSKNMCKSHHAINILF